MRFRVGSVWRAAPAALVEQISGRAEATPIPLAPPHVLGLVNLRGHAVPLLDLGSFLELPMQVASSRADTEQRTLIVAVGDMRVGILCDQVAGIIELPSAQLQPASIAAGKRLQAFAKAESEGPAGLTVILDIPALLEAARVS